jgi:hypothetical protein
MHVYTRFAACVVQADPSSTMIDIVHKASDEEKEVVAVYEVMCVRVYAEPRKMSHACI